VKVNAAWHAKHAMPPRATFDQRIAWHLAHAKHCACRPMPPTLRAALRHLGRGNYSAAVSIASKRV
jgi:hypothetical protein